MSPPTLEQAYEQCQKNRPHPGHNKTDRTEQNRDLMYQIVGILEITTIILTVEDEMTVRDHIRTLTKTDRPLHAIVHPNLTITSTKLTHQILSDPHRTV